MKKLFSAIIVASILYCAPNTGTITETDTGIVGKVSYSTGTGAAHARVQLFGARDTSRIALSSSSTDQNGNYDFHTLTPGAYNVWVETQDSLLALIDSIYVPKDSEVTANATLYKGGSVTAIVALQPGHSPTSVFVQALGTQRYANVNDSGRFTIIGLAQGEYTLRLVSTIPGYTPTYKSVTIASGVNDTLKDTIYMVYSGIPIVTGIQAAFDDYTGIARISWNKLNYSNFYEYKIYREVKGALNPQPMLIAVSPDSCSISDTLYHPLKPDSVWDSASSVLRAIVNFRYRVTVVNKSMAEGQVYNFADVAGSDPAGLVSTLAPLQNQKFKDSVGISCSWNKVSSATKYELQVSLKPDFSSVTFDSVTTDTMKAMPKLGLNYYYLRIRAWNGAGIWGFWNCVRRFAVVGDLFATAILGTETLNAQQVIGTPDGGFLIKAVTDSSPFWYSFIKTNALGHENWRSTFAYADIGNCSNILTSSDSGILAVCENYNAFESLDGLIKINRNGALIWRKAIRDSTGFISELRCVAKQDNGFIISYRTNISSAGMGVGHLIICDENGNPTSTSIIDSCWNTSPFVQVMGKDSLIVLTENLSVASDASDSNHLFFNGYNFLGERTSTADISVNKIMLVRGFNQTQDGNFVINGLGHYMMHTGVYVFNSQFQITNKIVMSDPGEFKVAVSQDGNFLFFFNGLLRKTTTEGNTIWETTPGYGAITPTSEGSIIAAASQSNGNIIVYKISKDGRSFNN